MKKKKVIVGISGGVDSAVSALLLKKQGYDVVGLFMRNWDSNLNNDFLGNNDLTTNDICTQEQDFNDAIEICKQLDIPLNRIDFVKEYWDKVFIYFIKEYEKGRTPNPDILCNKYIKFDLFLEEAMKSFNGDYIAMGHYAGVNFNQKTQEYELLKGEDDTKDQSYFLCKLNQTMLSKSLFPLASYKKRRVREIALENKLVVSQKKDSTGICFIGERNFTQFLQNYIPNQNGEIIDIETKAIIGHHIGVMYYTLGQRKGLNLGGQKEPYYVAKKDIENKKIFVTRLSNDKYLYSDKCIVDDVNWIVSLEKYVENPESFRCSAKFRYRQQDVLVEVNKLNNNYLIIFDKKQRAVTPGQEAVFYLDNICIGGGTISE
ncbi:tRNA 2-thiouridine(34) synthase MnmA [Spiroplasma endosymbiont of Aspidapion aeneum]|uniref:tRNA 2-thiouridine(34) synthase MnmA n=1 Tax=Spiroplasma endosymbiont of Aspidapion aeneum TaxID=3066276 RepID=UPI00313D45E2